MTCVMEPMLTVEEVAELLRVPVATLHQWRHKGTGPRSYRVGRYVRYRRDDLEAWLEENAKG
jgi:excisionase family DNA binding protein